MTTPKEGEPTARVRRMSATSSGSNTVIASVGEAIHASAKRVWIASSLALLAMTPEHSFSISPRVSREF